MSDDDKTTVTDPTIELSNHIDNMVLSAGLSLSDVFHALTMSLGVVAAHPALDATPSEELAEHVRLVVCDIIDEARHYRRTAERTPS